MLDLLRPFFRGDWAPYGESLCLADPAAARTNVAQWLSDPTHLSSALHRHAKFLDDAREHTAVASDWTLRYFVTLLPPVVVLTSLLKYSVPASSHDMTLALNDAGAPATFSISHVGTVLPNAHTAARYHALIWQHLAPLITNIARQTKVPGKILWGNARRTLLEIFGQALLLVRASPEHSATLIEDRRQLLESPMWPDGRRNPLFLRHRQLPLSHAGTTELLTLHASCCLAYRLPNAGHCGACPLDPRFRKPRLSRRSASR